MRRFIGVDVDEIETVKWWLDFECPCGASFDLLTRALLNMDTWTTECVDIEFPELPTALVEGFRVGRAKLFHNIELHNGPISDLVKP
jgi:hypothetical protein